MIIADLPYSEAVSHEDVSGGNTLLAVNAMALAFGKRTHTLAATDTTLRPVGRGRVTIGMGRGFAFAAGDVCHAETSYTAEGFDKVFSRKVHREGENFCFERVRVIALDLP